ncbi:MAG TPA: dTDP-glucose 4,6-dehydratase, partial [Acidobacteriota bacterium]|nr:dTDP-glucose 4,6-dehydratase [Acidobacteriota bacterium]
VVLDKLTYAGNLANLEDVDSDSRFHFVKGDIADAELVTTVIREFKPSTVVNFAAESHVDRSIEGPAAFIETNVVGAWVLLDSARKYWSDLSWEEKDSFRFLQISTDEVYGSLGESGAFSELTPMAPNSPYSASKASADHFARAYHETYGLPTIVTNCSNNYGPYQFPEKLIPLMVLNCLDGKPLPIYGDGGNIRDWLFVEDHCLGLLTVLERGRVGESYNLGGRCERRNLEIVDLICSIVEEYLPAARNPSMADRGMKEYSQLKVYVEDRPGHDRRYAIDSTKVETELQWRPSLTLEEGMRKTIGWYLDHQGWCEQVSTEYQRERLGLIEG